MQCTPVGTTIMRGNYHILSMKQSVTAHNQYQNRKTGKSMHMIVLVVCLQEHDDQRRSRKKCRLVDVRRRE